ncbi:hypothetical protein D3C86_2186490 [compost metagenome]
MQGRNEVDDQKRQVERALARIGEDHPDANGLNHGIGRLIEQIADKTGPRHVENG